MFLGDVSLGESFCAESIKSTRVNAFADWRVQSGIATLFVVCGMDLLHLLLCLEGIHYNFMAGKDLLYACDLPMMMCRINAHDCALLTAMCRADTQRL